MAIKTAFGGSNSYQYFRLEGTRIANQCDSIELKNWMTKLKSEEPILVQQAAAVCYAVSDLSPDLFRPYQKELIRVIKNNIHPAGPRFAYRLFCEISIDKESIGDVIDLSFKALMNRSSPVAVQVFAMTLIANNLKQYPDLAIELEAALVHGLDKGSAGYQSRARKIAQRHGLKLDEKP